MSRQTEAMCAFRNTVTCQPHIRPSMLIPRTGIPDVWLGIPGTHICTLVTDWGANCGAMNAHEPLFWVIIPSKFRLLGFLGCVNITTPSSHKTTARRAEWHSKRAAVSVMLTPRVTNAIVTCEIKSFWNNFETISVFYFTCKHVLNYFIERAGEYSWSAISLRNYSEIILGKIISVETSTNARIILFHM